MPSGPSSSSSSAQQRQEEQHAPAALPHHTSAFRLISRPGTRRRVLHKYHQTKVKQSERQTGIPSTDRTNSDKSGSSTPATTTTTSSSTSRASTSKKKRRYQRVAAMSSQADPSASPTAKLEAMFQGTTLRPTGPRLVEITSSNPQTPKSYSPAPPEFETIMSPNPGTNSIFTTLPILRDLLQTKTSVDQDKVAETCLNIHSDPLNPLPHLNREAHIEFLENGLGIDEDGDQLPSSFVVLDASRPWILYWCLVGLYALGVDLAPYRERLIETLRPIQNHKTGGFGGGNGQTSHSAVTYAAVLALCTVGGREAFQLIDRVKMWRWLSGLKQLDGGFTVCTGGEEDVRGVYCALTLISLLGLPTELAPEDIERLKLQSQQIQGGIKVGGWGHDAKNIPQNLLDGAAEYLGRCQTFEGGIAGAPGGMEAHGGYAFCALAGLSILGEPEVMLNKYLDLPALIRWLSARQFAPEGGFSGRTNKLVDGCYSTWVGGCWALVEAALNGPQEEEEGDNGDAHEEDDKKRENEAKKTEKGRGIVGSLWSRDGLVKYILGCCQNPTGGLRDKPGKFPDYYHSGYILLGLSSAQNYHYYIRTPTSVTKPPPPQVQLSSSAPEALPPPTPSAPAALRAAFAWRTSHYIPMYTSPGNFDNTVIERVLSTYDLDDENMTDWLDREDDEGVGESLGDSGEWWNGDRVRRAHPVFNVPFECVRDWETWVWGGAEAEGEVTE